MKDKLNAGAKIAFIALVIWFIAPALFPQLSAVWATVTEGRDQWVNAIKPKAPAVIIVTPTLAPNAPEAAPMQATAVPQPQPAAIPATMVPVIVNEVQPAPEPPEPLVNIAAGTVTEADAQFLADCAFGQATGGRVSPNCPANAGAMLGQGR